MLCTILPIQCVFLVLGNFSCFLAAHLFFWIFFATCSSIFNNTSFSWAVGSHLSGRWRMHLHSVILCHVCDKFNNQKFVRIGILNYFFIYPCLDSFSLCQLFFLLCWTVNCFWLGTYLLTSSRSIFCTSRSWRSTYCVQWTFPFLINLRTQSYNWQHRCCCRDVNC